jgi:hypothetical protein
MPAILKITADGDTAFKMAWQSSAGPPDPDPYTIYGEQFRKAVKECRNALDELALTLEDYAKDAARHERTLGAALRELASRGKRLNFLLFEGCAERRDVAIKVKRWLEGLRPEERLTISSDSTIHVPWGLVFGGDPRQLRDDAHDIADYTGFWAVRFKLNVVYTGMEFSPDERPHPRGNFRILSVLNREAFERAKTLVSDDTRTLLMELLNHPEREAYTTTDCVTKWNNMNDKDCLLNVFAHASGESIELADEDQIDIVGFRMDFLEPRRQSRQVLPECLVVLNGCRSAIGNKDNSFFTAFAEPGCCGFVGVEAPIPHGPALEFGTKLVYKLVYSGATVLDAVHELRKQHWPFGLLYGCYSRHDFSIEARP